MPLHWLRCLKSDDIHSASPASSPHYSAEITAVMRTQWGR
nr:MAG TPA: hypothetical protein [Caudoviricetes sp.]